MTFNRKEINQHLELAFNGLSICKMRYIRYLELIITGDLKWAKYIINLTKKSVKIAGILRRIQIRTSEKVMEKKFDMPLHKQSSHLLDLGLYNWVYTLVYCISY